MTGTNHTLTMEITKARWNIFEAHLGHDHPNTTSSRQSLETVMARPEERP
jgi:hypothetical protein